MLIGICGKSGSGKSYLAKQIIDFYNENAIHCDIDKIGHKTHSDPVTKKRLIDCFGEQILDKDNIIDRKKLSEIVFNSKERMKELEDITWKFMEDEIDNIINKNKDKIIILDWALLPNTKYFNLCFKKILLDIPYNTRKERVILRDIISEERFNLREKASPCYDKNKFDIVLENNEKKDLERLVKLL